MKRIVLIVLDSVGIGETPDANLYGDIGADTLGKLYKNIPNFKLPTLEKLGLKNISGTSFYSPHENNIAAFGKMYESSKGKDTTTGHWEMVGLQIDNPFPTFPNGFDKNILDEFTKKTGYEVLCNAPYSGTQVIADFGEEHMKTKKLIVYTSADSVLQIAAHEDIIGIDELYRVCDIAREITIKYNIGRVIARPFLGTNKDDFYRTTNRKDYALEPFDKIVLEALQENNINVYAVGKIEDIFLGKGIHDAVHTKSNLNGIDETLKYINQVEKGLIFTNLVDFDMLYGHRNDAEGYANALIEFDNHLPEIIDCLNDDDLLIITADHGCDPSDVSTDHTREYVPLLVYNKNINPVDLGIRMTFSDLASTIADFFDVKYICNGTSFKNEI